MDTHTSLSLYSYQPGLYPADTHTDTHTIQTDTHTDLVILIPALLDTHTKSLQLILIPKTDTHTEIHTGKWILIPSLMILIPVIFICHCSFKGYSYRGIVHTHTKLYRYSYQY